MEGAYSICVITHQGQYGVALGFGVSFFMPSASNRSQ